MLDDRVRADPDPWGTGRPPRAFVRGVRVAGLPADPLDPLTVTEADLGPLPQAVQRYRSSRSRAASRCARVLKSRNGVRTGFLSLYARAPSSRTTPTWVSGTAAGCIARPSRGPVVRSAGRTVRAGPTEVPVVRAPAGT